jgi:HsdM N-terminal domain
MAIRRSELYSPLWASCDEPRGGMDTGQYKDYVLVLLFIKYISDKYAGKPFAPSTIPPGSGFADNPTRPEARARCRGSWPTPRVCRPRCMARRKAKPLPAWHK